MTIAAQAENVGGCSVYIVYYTDNSL